MLTTSFREAKKEGVRKNKSFILKHFSKSKRVNLSKTIDILAISKMS